jgi:ribosomal protein S30
MKKIETRGRPKLPSKHKRSEFIKVRVTADEKKRVENMASNKGRSVPAYIRWKLGLTKADA